MANNTPRSMLNVSFSAEYSGDEFTPRSPWSYIRSHHPSGFSREHGQDRKSRSTERNQFRSPRSKTNSPRRQNSRNLRNTRSRNGTKRAISSSPPPTTRRSFDPTDNRHLWTMWRISITGKIVSDIMSRKERDISTKYVRTLRRPPAGLAKSIYISNQTRLAAYSLMNCGHCPDNTILTRDFIFFGIPRVILNKGVH